MGEKDGEREREMHALIHTYMRTYARMYTRTYARTRARDVRGGGLRGLPLLLRGAVPPAVPREAPVEACEAGKYGMDNVVYMCVYIYRERDTYILRHEAALRYSIRQSLRST